MSVKEQLAERLTVAPQLRSRISVVETVYHQQPGEPITEFSWQGSRWLETEEQPYSRKVTVGPEWEPLDMGWLRDSGVSLLMLRNEEGRFTQTIPTEEEKDRAARKVVEVGVLSHGGEVQPFAVVAPNDPPSRIRPINGSALYVRAPGGPARMTVVVIPR